ncbi:Cytochrome b/b6 domain protein [Nitrosococcus halophilus Nc 4]|uniref:Cytochrome b n=1 Tax=Nitrosococcus halophilus (strain Nc4) TaxID=472759 RepID=D5C3G6_NITHN|nr:cytochrome bc complex cytochrome b subunit [Nitrosococcus halophilus]ADE16873.1 Cytochrome b/b6 domain protein [Nitrosococcus halophilus Nc 4]
MKNIISQTFTWIDSRLPISKLWKEHASEYYAPKNFNIWYFFGSLAMLVLVIQLLTGLFLTMNYKPAADLAFGSVEYIMRDVEWGWLIRYMHSTGASAFFILIYLHMFRGIIYGSHKKPREMVWIIGVLIYLTLVAEAFMGYLLPWGQMSYWGAQVTISLFGAFPMIGEGLAEWIRGDYVVSDATLNRFFAFHVFLMPLLLIALVVAHIMALHETGSNNPDGVEIKEKKDPNGLPLDGIPFHPYYTVKDLWGFGIFLFLFAWVVFYAPELGGWFLEHPNFEPANPLATPEHIRPLWYLTPFYSILRSIPDKLLGVIAMDAAIFLWFFLPWLDRSPVKSIRYRGLLFKSAIGLFVVSFLALGYLGTQPATPLLTMFARVFSILYFAFFLLMPIYTKLDKTKPVPERVTSK